MLTLEKSVSIDGLNIKLDYSLNCKSDNVIYMAICKHCEKPTQWYFGQTSNPLHIRLNGHRNCFKFSVADSKIFEKSALSLHVHNDHVWDFGNKLGNFNFGIIKQVRPSALDRAEDFFIWETKADIVGLNRYKVVK